MSQGSHRTCEICGLKERHSKVKVQYSYFPKDEHRCKEWVRVVGKEDLVHLPIEKLNKLKCVCEQHFHKQDFKRKTHRLKMSAVPKLNLSLPPLTDEQLKDFPLHMFRREEGEPASTSTQQPSTSQSGSKSSASMYSFSDTVAVHTDTSAAASELQGMKTMVLAVTSEVTSKDDYIPVQVGSGAAQSESLKGVKRKRIENENEELTPRKKRLVERLIRTKESLRSLRKSANIIDKMKSPVLKEIVLNAVKNENRKPKGKRWTTQYKISCLSILKRSRRTYNYLSATVPMPSIKTLQNVLKKVPITTGINKAVLTHLKRIAVDRDPINNLCCLAFDEMAIKSRLIYNEGNDVVEGYEDLGELGRTERIADHALVFMLQGIRTKFKQPLAHYFTKGTISSAQLAIIIKQIIQSVSECGFNIINTVCDQGPTNIGALTILKAASGPGENASTEHFFKIEDKKIYIVYDVPHLFKSIRNNFLKAGAMLFDNKIAKWEHLSEVEKENKSFLYLSKITESHIRPKYRQKMKVKYAAQILSNTVAAVLKLLSRSEKNAQKATELLNTALVVGELDNLFDCTNGPSGPDDIKKTKRENVSIKTNHLNLWTEYIKKMENMKFLKQNGSELKNVKCIRGYITTLKSLKDIWREVNGMGLKYLNLRNINQDPLENCFGVIRQHSPTNRNPTAAHFTVALKTAIVTKLTAPHSRGSNCEKDNKSLLTDFHTLVFGSDICSKDTEKQQHLQVDNIPAEEDCESEIVNFSLPEIDGDEVDAVDEDLAKLANQPVVYIAGYLVSKILKKIECTQCKANLSVEDPKNNPIYNYTVLREWWDDKLSLTYPSVTFCNMLQILIEITEKEIITKLQEPNIKALTVTLYTVGIDISKYFQCELHAIDASKLCFEFISKLLIRRQCQRINQSLASKEEDLASIYKKGEQLGQSK